MAPTTKHAANPHATDASAGVGTFMLTLCRLEAPVSIRPPQNPQLARFKFFMSRSRQADGNQHLFLHMGYFPTLGDAERCAQVMRARYPQARPTRTPPELLHRAGSDESANSPAQAQPPVLQGIPPAEASALTDTQVLHILETRRVHLSELGRQLPEIPEITLMRPDDTSTRRALKEAVVQGAPIPFVVELCRSDKPIELRSVPSLDIFRAYTLYLAEGTQAGRAWHALRLGFFGDAVSAKQVAHYAHARFASIAVLPINETERTHASKKPITLTLLAKPAPSSIDDILAADHANTAAAAAEKAKYLAPSPPAGAPSAPKSENRSTATPKKERRKDELEQTLEMLAADELWKNTDSDSLSETGVRHLKIEVKKRKSRG
jgi:hypothetical protein